MTKSHEFLNKNTDLKSLSQDIYDFLVDKKFDDAKIDEDEHGQWFEIQASKTGIKQTLVASRKALHIIISGNPNKFEIKMITGESGKNYAAALLIPGFSWAGLLVGLPLGRRFNKKLWEFIEESVKSNSVKKQESDNNSKNSEFGMTKSRSTDDDDPIEIIKKMLAKGEITPEEFKEKMELLKE